MARSDIPACNAILAAKVFHHLAPDGLERLLGQAATASLPNGCVIVFDHMFAAPSGGWAGNGGAQCGGANAGIPITLYLFGCAAISPHNSLTERKGSALPLPGEVARWYNQGMAEPDTSDALHYERGKLMLGGVGLRPDDPTEVWTANSWHAGVVKFARHWQSFSVQ